MHLRRAAQGVGILHTVELVLAMARHHTGPREHGAEVGRRQALPHLRAELLELGGEDPVGAHLRLDAHCGRDVRRPQQHPQVGDRQHEHPEHPVGAVDESQALLGLELDRAQPGGGERVGRGHQRAVGVAHVALTHQRERAVRQRGKVARAAQRPVLAHDGRDPRRQQRGHQLGGLEADAGVPGRQSREPQQHECADHLALDLGPGPGGVRAHQRPLQLLAHLGRDVAGGERAETRRDAVRRVGRRRQLLDHRPRLLDRDDRVVGQRDRRAVAGHGHHVVDGERADVHVHRHGSIELPGGVRAAEGRRRRCLRCETAYRWSRRDEVPSRDPASEQVALMVAGSRDRR